MDDAGHGLRGSRATPSAALLEQLRACYGLDETKAAADLGGSSSLNLLVTRAGDRHVARVYRPYVTAARLGAIQRVRQVLACGGIPCTEPISTSDGEPWAVIEGRLVEVETFVERDANMDSWERLEVGLPWLGRVHSRLRGLEVEPEGR